MSEPRRWCIATERDCDCVLPPQSTGLLDLPKSWCEVVEASAYDALKIESDEADALNTKLGDILTRIANVLKGEPDSRSLHSWADLPKLANAMRTENERLVAELESYEGMEGRCPVGHNKRFTYDEEQTGRGCVACERDTAISELAEAITKGKKLCCAHGNVLIELAELRARAERLHEALRNASIINADGGPECDQCDHAWEYDDPESEQHTPDCPASPDFLGAKGASDA